MDETIKWELQGLLADTEWDAWNSFYYKEMERFLINQQSFPYSYLDQPSKGLSLFILDWTNAGIKANKVVYKRVCNPEK